MPMHVLSSRSASLLLTLPALLVSPCLAAKKREAPPPQPANQYATFDAHAPEKVTVAADPCDDPKACSFFRLPYIQHGFLPIRVIVTNDSDHAISLDDARMQFISVNQDKIPAALPEDLQRRLFSTKQVAGRKIPLPAPLPPITLHDKPVDKQITADDADFGFSGTVVNPHTTLAGYLFYDVRELDDPALKGAELYVKQVHSADGKQQLFAFQIPFDRWLAAQNKPQPKVAQKPTTTSNTPDTLPTPR